jgi:NAD+ diphosphatase
VVTRRTDIHYPKPKVVTLTQATEVGTVYRPDELRAIADVAREHGLRVHMDGARFANAVAGLGLSPAEADLARRRRCPVLRRHQDGLAGRRGGGFLRPQLSEDFAYRCKQAGQLASKMRFLSAPWLGILEDGAWLRTPRRPTRWLADWPPVSRKRPDGWRCFRCRRTASSFTCRAASRPACANAAGCSTTSSAPAARVSCAAGTRTGDRRSAARRHPRTGAGPHERLALLSASARAPLVDARFGGLPRLVCAGRRCGFVHWDNPAPVLAALVECQGRIVLARNHAWAAGAFGLITGFLERDEEPAAGVAREVREELGLAADAVTLIGVYPFARKHEVIIAYHVLAAGEIRLNEELAEFRLIVPEKLKAWDFGTGLAVRDWLARRRVAACRRG